MKRLLSKADTTNIISLLLFGYLFLYPLFTSPYQIQNMVSFFYQIVLASSLILIWGYCGIFSFGQAAFFGIGGYVYAVVALNFGNLAFTPLALILALAAGFAVAGIFGYFLFYGGVNDAFMGVITLCFTVACCTFMGQTTGEQWRIGQVLLNGYNGINRVPTLYIGNFEFSGTYLYYLAVLIILAILVVYKFIEKRPLGYAMVALRENTHRSSLLGYNAAKIKTLVFAFGGMIAALAGVLYTMWGGYIIPASMDLAAGTIPVVLVAAGGRKNPTAVFLFSLLYLWFSQSLASSGTEFALVILGVLLILVIIFVPDGIVASLFKFVDRHVFKISEYDVGHAEGKKNG